MIGRYVLVGLLLTVSGHGQAPGPASDKPPLRVTTRMVQVSVVVHRGAGPVTGLTKEDFQVFDNGKEQRIAAFSGGAPTVGTTGSSPASGATEPPARVYSNRADRGALGVTIVLLDALNTPPSELSAAKAQVIRCFNELQGNNSVALYALNGRLLVLHDFTENIVHLRQALDDYQAGNLPMFDLNSSNTGLAPNPGTAGTPLGRMAVNANTELGSLYSTRRAQLTRDALEAIARHVQPIPGRKNLVWISAGFPVEIATIGGSESLRGETRNLARILTNADLAVYPVQTSGLTGISSIGANVASTSRRPGGAASLAPRVPASMEMLADQTGGKAYYGTNDLAAAVKHAISDAEASYSLGFYPAEETLDGNFHEIRVHLKARGADIRYRPGYFATPDSTPTPEQRQAQLNEAVSSPFESTTIAMKVRLDPAEQPKPGSFRLIVGIDLNALTLAAKGDHHIGGAQMMMIQESANGRRLQGTDETIRLDLAPDEFDRMSKDGLVLVKYVVPAADVFQIRVFVLDLNSGALGSVYVPVARN